MENISVHTLYQLCAVVDGELGVPTPLGWLQIWGHLPAAGQKLRGNYAALYQKWVEIDITPFVGPAFVPVPVYVLAIQGTKDAKELLEDFIVEEQVPFEPVAGAKISKGSHEALADVLHLKDDKSGVSLADSLRGLPASSRLIVTGHSLGGNLASVMGPWIAAHVPNFVSPHKPEFPQNLGVVTFAAPTAGNLAFAQYLNRQATYHAHFNVNDVVSNVWAESGELCLAHLEKLFPAPELSPAPDAVKALLAVIKSKMAKNKVSYAQTRGELFTYPCATPPEAVTGAEKRWLWELDYQHNDAYNHMFLTTPADRAQASAGPAQAATSDGYRVELVVINKTGATIKCTDTCCERYDVPGFQLGIGAEIPSGQTATYRSTTNNRLFATFAGGGQSWQMAMTCPKSSHNSACGSPNAGLQPYSRTGTPAAFTYQPGEPNQADWDDGNENKGKVVPYGACSEVVKP